LTLNCFQSPAAIDVATILQTYPRLKSIQSTSACEDWSCTISVEDIFPHGLAMRPLLSLDKTKGVPLIDPSFGVVGSHPSLSLRSIVVSGGNIDGVVFFQGLLDRQTVTELGRRVLGSVLHFGSNDLPGVYHQTLASIINAMPHLQHLQLMRPKHQSANLATAMEAFRLCCPAAQTLSIDLPWSIVCDLIRPGVLNHTTGPNLDHLDWEPAHNVQWGTLQANIAAFQGNRRRPLDKEIMNRQEKNSWGPRL